MYKGNLKLHVNRSGMRYFVFTGSCKHLRSIVVAMSIADYHNHREDVALEEIEQWCQFVQDMKVRVRVKRFVWHYSCVIWDHLCWSAHKHKLGRGRWVPASYQILSNSIQWLQRRMWKCLNQSKARLAIFVEGSVGKRKEDVVNLLPVPSMVAEKKLKNVSCNHRQGWPLLLTDWLQKHKLGRERWVLIS